MATNRKPKPERTDTFVNFRARKALVDRYREVVRREERTLSQDLRRYMAERVERDQLEEAA